MHRIRVVLFITVCFLFGSVKAQSTLVQPKIKNISTHNWKVKHRLNMLSDTNTFIINYDSADANLWGNSYLYYQSYLMNVNYTSQDSSIINYAVVNYVQVAFDSLIDPYNNQSHSSDSVTSLSIDTIIIPLIQVNHSGGNDTLEVQINAVNSFGYPTATILNDSKIISKVIGDTNNSNYKSYIKIPENYNLGSGSKFAITVKYNGAKTDSCWFIYGCGTFAGTCDSTGPYTLAEPSNFSKILKANGSFTANSFVEYNKFKANGIYPNDSGAEFYTDCNNDSVYTPGTDGVTYFQNIDVYAMVTTTPLGINQINSPLVFVGQNQPNPFNNSTVINYNLTRASDVVFRVYDMTGRKIIGNTYTEVAPGPHSITLDANQFSAGIYFYSFNANGNVITKKMVITE